MTPNKYITIEISSLDRILGDLKCDSDRVVSVSQIKEALIENRLIECTCECHDPNVQMMHCFPCCNDGWEFHKKPNKK